MANVLLGVIYGVFVKAGDKVSGPLLKQIDITDSANCESALRYVLFQK